MIDVISGGRLIAGWSWVADRSIQLHDQSDLHARSMYSEAVDLVIRSVDGAGAVRTSRQALGVEVREPVAAADTETAPADLDSGSRQQGND